MLDSNGATMTLLHWPRLSMSFPILRHASDARGFPSRGGETAAVWRSFASSDFVLGGQGSVNPSRGGANGSDVTESMVYNFIP